MTDEPAKRPFLFSRRVRRAAFVCYTAALIAATHWPSLRLPPIVPRTDLWVHAGVMGGWTVLFALAEWWGRGGWRAWSSLAVTAAASYAFAAVDEVTQGIPGLNRVVDWSDLWANWLGVSLALAGLAAARVCLPGRSPSRRLAADTTSTHDRRAPGQPEA